MGMRARAAQNGKLARTEGGVSTTGSDSIEDAAQSTVEILEERRKMKQARKTGGADGQERDPALDTIEEKEAVESNTSVKKRRKIVQTNESGEGAEMTDGTRSKTRKSKSKSKKIDRCEKAARGIATKGKAGKGASSDEGKGGKKKRNRAEKGL